jgi:hypothetical protein
MTDHDADKIAITVRWWDGYLEEFECTESREGAYLLWMRLSNGHNRYVPLNQVRWYERTPESHAKEVTL